LHHWTLTFRAEAMILVLRYRFRRCDESRRPKLKPDIVLKARQLNGLHVVRVF
jgi:hypothetical protein